MFDIDLFAKTSSCVEIKNREVVRDFNFEIMKSMKIANDSLAEQLTKYKRAFEVLKKADMFILEESFGLYKAITGDKIEYLEKEEYELLEELMKNENC